MTLAKGAMARPDKITEAISPPRVNWFEWIKYTPPTTMATVMSCWIEVVMPMIQLVRLRMRLYESAPAKLDISQRRCK